MEQLLLSSTYKAACSAADALIWCAFEAAVAVVVGGKEIGGISRKRRRRWRAHTMTDRYGLRSWWGRQSCACLVSGVSQMLFSPGLRAMGLGFWASLSASDGASSCPCNSWVTSLVRTTMSSMCARKKLGSNIKLPFAISMQEEFARLASSSNSCFETFLRTNQL